MDYYEGNISDPYESMLIIYWRKLVMCLAKVLTKPTVFDTITLKCRCFKVLKR